MHVRMGIRQQPVLAGAISLIQTGKFSILLLHSRVCASSELELDESRLSVLGPCFLCILFQDVLGQKYRSHQYLRKQRKAHYETFFGPQNVSCSFANILSSPLLFSHPEQQESNIHQGGMIG